MVLLTLLLQTPESLNKAGGYDHREALFGKPPYGGSITQQVYYTETTLCDSVNEEDKKTGRPRKKDKDGNVIPWEAPFILMADRGGCTFVQKARNAQKAGASALIVADNTCLCTDDECMGKTDIGTHNCESAEPIMADDGSGQDISIPSFLMFKHDADPLKTELQKDTPVQVQMAWSLPNPDNRVEYDLSTTPVDKITKDFYKEWKPLAEALGKSASFTPHMYVLDGKKMGCHASTGENFCYTLCTNAGRYCSTDPDSDLDGGVSGQDVLWESLRRLCIWQTYGSDGIGSQFWDYTSHFNDRCMESYFKDENCVADALKFAGVDARKVETCMNEDGVKENVVNELLAQEIEFQENRGVVVVPAAYVNTATLRGAMDPTTLFVAICAGFAVDSKPDICLKCGNCADASGCVTSGKCDAGSIYGAGNAPGETVSKHTFFTSMILLVVLFTGLGAWHYKSSQDDMRNQVRGILADYLPLEDQDSPTNGNPMAFASGVQSTSLMT